MTQDSLGSRVLVVGDAGSGKTTLGAAIASHLGVPFTDIDTLYWSPNWQPVEAPVLCERVERATSADGWVLAGNYSSQRHVSWPRAQSVVWLDLSLQVVIPRLVARTYRRWRTRELLWGTNYESFPRALMLWDERQSVIGWTLGHHRPLRRRYEAAMQDPQLGHLRWLRLRSPREVAAFGRGLRAASQ